MARLSNRAKLGYVGLPGSVTPDDDATKENFDTVYYAFDEDGRWMGTSEPAIDVAGMVASYIAPAPEGTRMMDPCAGKGYAAARIAAGVGVDKANLYLNDLHEARAEIAAQYGGKTLSADAIDGHTGLQAAKQMFGIGYLNPPFDDQTQEEGGGRFEQLFFAKIVDDRRWIQDEGIAVLVAPQDIFARRTIAYHLARCYDQLTILAVPKAIRFFRETVIIGIVRKQPRGRIESAERAVTIIEKLSATLPEISYQQEPRYVIPAPVLLDVPIWRDRMNANAHMAAQDVTKTGGAWSAKAYVRRMRDARRPAEVPLPLWPPSQVQTILGVAAGKINGQHVTIGGRSVQIKGTTKVDTHKWTEKETLNNGTQVIKRHEVTRRTPFIVAVDDETAAISQYTGDAGMQKLMEHEDAARSMMAAYERTAPPLWQGRMRDDVRSILDTVVPLSGAALPGQKPGLLMMQKQLVAALHHGFTVPNPRTGRLWKQLFLSAEMGCGKSKMGATLAHVLQTLNLLAKGKPVILSAPNHLIGERAALAAYDLYQRDEEAYRREHGKKTPLSLGEVSQWVGEWRDLFPHWHTEILETPSEVAAFMRRAERHVDTPHVGFIALSKLTNASGREVVTQEQYDRPHIGEWTEKSKQLLGFATNERALVHRNGDRKLFYDITIAEEELERKAKADELKRKEKPADDEEEVTSAHEARPGVSDRTRKRDRLFRCGVAFRTQRGARPLPRGEGQFCPTCGRRAAKNTEELVLIGRDKIKDAGRSAKCLYCGEALTAMSRRQDSVGDRDVAVFSSAEWSQHAHDASGQQRAIPWGVRPKSNPRMPLGEFLAKRYRGRIALYIADECHKHKGAATDVGGIYGQMIAASDRHLGMTGTLYGGKASTVFWLLQRVGNPYVRALYGWKDEKEFIRQMGVMDTVTTEKVREGVSNVNSGRNKSDTTVNEFERAGITAELAAIIQTQAAIVRLAQMGFILPEYEEGVEFMTMPKEMQQLYGQIAAEARDMLLEPGGKDALGSYLQAMLTWPMAPWHPMRITSNNLSKEAKHAGIPDEFNPGIYILPTLPADTILPHHRNLAKAIVASKAAGRRTLLFAQHTGDLDIMPDLQEKVTRLAREEYGVDIKIAIMRAKVKGGKRLAWFGERERDGTDAVICHPRLVETGLNLIAWPDIRFCEPTYELAVALQARKRAMRPTQTRNCTVTWDAYENTMMETAIQIIGAKAMAAMLLAGDDLTSGLLQFDEGMSLLQELAKRALSDARGENKALSDIHAQMHQLSQATRAEMMVGASDLVGMDDGAFATVVEQIVAETVAAIDEELGAPSSPDEIVAVVAAIAGAGDVAVADAFTPPTRVELPTTRWVPFNRLPKVARRGVKRETVKEEEEALQGTLFEL